MFHHDLGKSTLQIRAEQQREVNSRKRELSNVATALMNLERQKLIEAITRDDFEQVVGYFHAAMIAELDAHEFGTYCHDDGDLLTDTLDRLSFLDSVVFSEEMFERLSWDASWVVEECERSICDYCNDQIDEGENDG